MTQSKKEFSKEEILLIKKSIAMARDSIIEPFPKDFSIWLIAASSALFLSMKIFYQSKISKERVN